jgi:4-hydroxythreonine-4-phosphate dehydrogenase
MNLKNAPISKYSQIKIGITFGDPSGIGPSIIAKALTSIAGGAKFVLIGDKWVFERAGAGGFSNPQNIKFVDLNNVSHQKFKFGKISAEYGRASIEYLDKALELLLRDQIDCLVTCPISKEAINLAGYRYLGHTEYLAQKTGTRNLGMMLLNQDLRFVLVTRHIAIKEVPKSLTKNRIFSATILAQESLKKFFLIKNPRIVVCALNPHASDNGLIGDEESKIILPAIKKLRTKIRHIQGPLPADVAIAKAKNQDYDCVIAMYHDQALIPLKMLGSDTGVNLTLGLDFIRTSPLHGTAFDIAGTNFANPNALIAAIKLAARCTTNLKKA